MDIVNELREVVNKAGKKYLLYNDHDVLYLPLHVPVGIPMLLFMKDFFEKYVSLIGESTEILKKFDVDVDGVIKNVCKFREAYIQMHKAILSGNADTAYQEMATVLSQNEFFIKTEIKRQDSPLLLYRARTGINWTQKEDFYHIPFNKTYLCDSYRFSIAGYPSLYVGYSKEVCKKEMRGEDCSCIAMELNGEIPVIDLTWNNKDVKQGLTNIFLQAYPIIAACYVVPFFCNNMKKECPDVKQKFKEQYIFPQFITMFIKEHLGVDGIVYFTTRDENLDSQKDDSKNVAFFPKYSDNKLYDNELLEKFEWGEITTI